MYSTAIFEKLRQDTLSKKETFIGYMEIAEQMNKQIYMYMETSQNWILAKNNIYIYWQKVSMKKHRVKSLWGKMRKKERQDMKTNNAGISFYLFQKETSLPKKIWLAPPIHLCPEMRIFRLGRLPLCSCATFHCPFCCRDSLVGHAPISYSLSFVIHSRTFHLAFLIAPCSAVVSGNAWL